MKEPKAIIENSKGEVKDVIFVCKNCNRVAIFTNEWIDDLTIFKPFGKRMVCPDCKNSGFEIRTNE